MNTEQRTRAPKNAARLPPVLTLDAFKEIAHRREMREEIAKESARLNMHMEIERLTGELSKLTAPMREMALTRITALQK